MVDVEQVTILRCIVDRLICHLEEVAQEQAAGNAGRYPRPNRTEDITTNIQTLIEDMTAQAEHLEYQGQKAREVIHLLTTAQQQLGGIVSRGIKAPPRAAPFTP